jgi:peroxiredoxin
MMVGLACCITIEIHYLGRTIFDLNLSALKTTLYFPFLLLFSFLIFSCGPTTEENPPVDIVVDDFGLHDHNGDFHQLYYHSDANAIVLYTQGNACPIVRNAVRDLAEVQEKFASQDVRFFLLNAHLQDNRVSIKQEAEDFDFPFPVLVDESQLVAEALGITRTAEAIVIDPKSWKIVFRGPVNDRVHYESQKEKAANEYLKDALTDFLTGKPIAEKYVSSPGCLVMYAEPKESVNAPTFVHDVAPILQKRCINCHRAGGIAPWAMVSYEMVRGWSPMIREVVRTRRMPPWQADPHIGQFSNDLSLTSEEMRTIVHWVENGAIRGAGDDPLLGMDMIPETWALGQPDWVVTLDTQRIQATGVVDYRYIEKEVSFQEDRWVKAVEILPGNRQVLHHTLVSVTYPDGVDAPMDRANRWLDGLFATYAPGTEPEVFPEGSGRFLPAGSKLVFQMHYTPTGKAETDQTRLGIFFADQPAEKEFLIKGPANGRFAIPPGAKAHPVQASWQFEEEVTLYGMLPHMHFRGKSMRYTAQYPNGEAEVLMSVPNYNFNWQRYYLLTEPKVLPPGTTILCEATFDNSVQNRFNPDPTATVYWGDQSFEEMMIGYISYVKGRNRETVAMN